MAPPTFDLQSHSRYSDGSLAPADVVRAAVTAGVSLLALTDHDTAAGVPEAAQEAAEAGIGLVPATEISAIWDSGRDLHILGYLVDPHEPRLVNALKSSRADRERRAAEMADLLRGLGFEVKDAALARRSAQGKPIGRPHLAAAVVAAEANHDRLAAAGLLEPSAFLKAYLTPGKPAFRPRKWPSVQEAIELIHAAGGVAVWAHPFWDVCDPGTVLSTIDAFAGDGLDGVEAFYTTHTRDQTVLLARRCSELGLLSTGSSDFHGPEHPTFSGFRAFATYGLQPRLGPLAEPR